MYKQLPASRFLTEICHTSGFTVSDGRVKTRTHGASVAGGSLDNANVGPVYYVPDVTKTWQLFGDR